MVKKLMSEKEAGRLPEYNSTKFSMEKPLSIKKKEISKKWE